MLEYVKQGGELSDEDQVQIFDFPNCVEIVTAYAKREELIAESEKED